MDQSRTRAFQIVSLALLAWFAFQFIGRVHVLLAIGLLLFLACNVAVVWMLRFEQQRLSSLYQLPFVKSYVDWVCGWTGDQPLVEHQALCVTNELLLHSDEDFRVAAARAKQVVKGHDQGIDLILGRICDVVALRKRRRDGSRQPPLGCFLLVGNPGIGKRYLARILAKLLYRDNSVYTIDCAKETIDSLLGDRITPAPFIEAVRRVSFHMVILDGIEAASPELMRALQPILQRGIYRSSSTGREVSFQHATIIMTTNRAVSSLSAISKQASTERARHEKAVEAIITETSIARETLRAVSDIIYCSPPSDEVKSQVTAMLMIKECQAHGFQLKTVDPLIIASEAIRITEETGFSELPQNVKKLLSKPLLAAGRQDRTLMSLHIRLPDSQAVGVPHD